jgi:cytochrome c oxidase assembly protein subunit 15
MPFDTTRRSVPRADDPNRHRFTILVGYATLALLLAGGLVTSTGSGLAVPDWPLSFGQVFPPMIGGVLYEHGHRLVAASVGLLTLILAIWYQLREPRPWVRRLALLALLAVIGQGVLGGVTVLLRLPISISVAHACLAQAFFCLIVALAVLTSRRFVAGAPEPGVGEGIRSIRGMALLATTMVFAQLVLGALMRHTGAGLAIPDFPLAFGRLIPPLASPLIALHFVHRVGGLLVAAIVVLTAVCVLRRHHGRSGLLTPAALAVGLVVVQIALGGATVLTRLAVLPATVHLAVGALLMATCLVLTIRTWRSAERLGKETLRLDRGMETVA